jgi:hypothetical protein
MVIKVKLETKIMQNFSIREKFPLINRIMVKLEITIDQIRSSREEGN